MTEATPTEERNLPLTSWDLLPAAHGGLPLTITARLSEGLSAVTAAVQAIASAMASLPVWVYRTDGAGRSIDLNHPVMRMVRAGPNRHQSWPDWVEFMVAQILLRGNGLSAIETDTEGRIIGLSPAPWDGVGVEILSSGRLIYDVTEQGGVIGNNGKRRRLLDGEVVHIRDRSDDGLIGKSRLSRAAMTFNAAYSTAQHAGRSFENGMFPSGAFSTEGKLGTDSRQALRAALTEAFAGPTKAGKFLILDQGAKFSPITVTPEDAELLASRRFSTEEVLRIFQVPPPIAGDYQFGSFTNSETAGRWFAQHCIRSWTRKFEAELARSLFSETERQTHTIEFDLSDLLRGDPETRWKSHQIAVQAKILTPNEVREIEGFNPRPDGDSLAAPSATPNNGDANGDANSGDR